MSCIIANFMAFIPTTALSRISSSYVKSLACDLSNVSQSIKPENADHLSANFTSPYAYKPSIYNKHYPSRQSCQPVVTFDARRAASGNEDKQALDAVLKFYSAIKSQNIDELSELIGEECRCVCNFLSFFQAFHGKEQVLGFLSLLMDKFGKNIQIVVKPTLQDGMNIGVHWKLEWDTMHMPLGKGVSFHVLHSYHGRVVIRNMEMFMEPLLYFGPFRLQVMAIMTALADRAIWLATSENKLTRILLVFLSVLSIATLFLFTRIALQKPWNKV